MFNLAGKETFNAYEAFQLITLVALFPFRQLLPKLIASAFWWPSTDTDGKNAVNYAHNQNEEKYYSDKFSIARVYVNRSAELYALYLLVICALNMPNACRLLECTNTLHRHMGMRFS